MNTNLDDAIMQLLDLVRTGRIAPSGVTICACRNRNAVAVEMERRCWYCSLADAADKVERELRYATPEETPALRRTYHEGNVRNVSEEDRRAGY